MLTTLQPGFYLGIDIGSNKTEAVITNQSGFVLGRAECEGSNPHNSSLRDAYRSILLADAMATEAAEKKNPGTVIGRYEAVCIGMAGFDTAGDKRVLREFISHLPSTSEIFQQKRLIIVNNGLIGLMAGSEKSWGICIRANTGSSCYGLSSAGKEATAGGWGYFLGDQGSAYIIGRKILRQVMKEYDGRAPKTMLTKKVLEHLHLDSPHDLVQWAYQPSPAIREIARLSHIHDDPELMDCVELAGFLNEAVEKVVEAYDAVYRRLSFPTDQPLPVVLMGELFALKGHYADKVTRSILNRTPNARVSFPKRSAAEGAVRLAQLGTNPSIFPDSALVMINPQ